MFPIFIAALRQTSKALVALLTLQSFFIFSERSFSIERGGPYCGIYAVYGAASSLGEKCNFSDLVHEDFVTSHRGSSAADLAKCVKRIGLNSQLFTGLGADSLHSANEPLVLHVARYGSLHRYNHWLLFLGMADYETCLIADESGSVTHVNLADLLAQWDGSALLVFRGSSPKSTFDHPELAGFAYCSLLILSLIGFSIWSKSLVLRNYVKTAFQLGTFTLLCGLPFINDAIAPTGVLRNPHLTEFIHRAVHRRGYVEVDVSQFRRLLEGSGAQVIDARYKEDFASGHLSMAINIPVDASYGEFLEYSSKLSRSRPVVIYCQSSGCPFSDYVADALLSQGFEDIRIFRGGWVEWTQQSNVK